MYFADISGAKMELDSSQVIFAIIFGIILMFLMSGFIVVMVLIHRQRQFKNQQKIDTITAEYEKTILSVEKEIREQTLVQVGLELHDNIGQILSLTKLTLSHSDPERIQDAKKLLSKAIKEVRSLSKSINVEWANEVNLKDFIEDELGKITRLGFCETRFKLNGESLNLDKNIKLVLIRMIQECLNNAIKHASPEWIRITIDHRPHEMEITIQDNGIGFDLSQTSDGLGMSNMESRMKTIGGRVVVSSVLHHGTEVRLILPV